MLILRQAQLSDMFYILGEIRMPIDFPRLVSWIFKKRTRSQTNVLDFNVRQSGEVRAQIKQKMTGLAKSRYAGPVLFDQMLIQNTYFSSENDP